MPFTDGGSSNATRPAVEVVPSSVRPSRRSRFAVAILVVAAFSFFIPVASVVAQSAGASHAPSTAAKATAVTKPTATTSTTSTPKATSTQTPSAPTVPAGFVTAKGTKLMLDGKPYTFVGFNLNNANGRVTCEWKVPGMTVDQALDAIGPSQQVFRAWFFQPLVTRAGKIDWSVFDHTLDVAASHGEKVIPVLGNQWDTCDSGQYRNEAWYNNGYNVAPDGPHSPLSYQDWVKAVVVRYATNPTIMSWQLLNEPEDATGGKGGPCSPTAAKTLQSFVHTMAAVVKSIDPYHLLSIGTAGFGLCGAIATEWVSLNSDPNVDICNYHDYGDPRLPLLQGMTNGLGARVKQAAQLNKPLMVDELGVDLQKHANGSYATRADLVASRVNDSFSAGIVGVLVWDWNSPYRTPYDVGVGDPVLQVLAKYTSKEQH